MLAVANGTVSALDGVQTCLFILSLLVFLFTRVHVGAIGLCLQTHIEQHMSVSAQQSLPFVASTS